MIGWAIAECVEPSEVVQAVADVEAWGFPRPIDDSEIVGAVWFRMGRAVVWWYEAATAPGQPDAWMHLAVAPRYHGRWPVRRWHYAAQFMGELLGASRLVFGTSAALPGGDGVAAYAKRLGWTRDEASGLWYLVLGGGADAWANSRKVASPG